MGQRGDQGPVQFLLITELLRCCFFVFFLVGGGLHLQHMDVSRLGVELELYLLACIYSHSNPRSEVHLRPTPQLTAMPDP